MFQKILLAQDGSDHANRAAEYAVQLAKKFQGTIDIVYVVDGSKAKSDVLHSADKYLIKKKREEKLTRAKEMAQAENITCSTCEPANCETSIVSCLNHKIKTAENFLTKISLLFFCEYANNC